MNAPADHDNRHSGWWGGAVAALIVLPMAITAAAVWTSRRRRWPWAHRPSGLLAAAGAITAAAGTATMTTAGIDPRWVMVLAVWTVQLAGVPTAWWATTAWVEHRHREGLLPPADTGRIDDAMHAGRRAALGIDTTATGQPISGLSVGIALDGDLPWTRPDPGNPARQLLVVPDAATHNAVIGMTGSGKTTFLTRMASEALAAGNSVLVLDGKGDRGLQDDLATVAARHGIPVHLWPQKPFAGWEGDGRTVGERLRAALTPPDSPDFYKAVSSVFLMGVCDTPSGPPRNSSELVQRLAEPLNWVAKPVYRRAITSVLATKGAEHLQTGVLLPAANVLGDLNGTCDGSTDPDEPGWHFTEGQFCALVRLDTRTTPEASAVAAAWIMRELDTWAAGRTRADRRIEVILDEAGALTSHAVGGGMVQFAERGRSANLRLWVSAQTWPGLLPDSEERERLIDAGMALWLLSMPSPEEPAARAGTRWRIEVGHQVGEDGTRTGAAAQRVQNTYAVDPDRVRRFIPGDVVAIHRGRHRYARVLERTSSPGRG